MTDYIDLDTLDRTEGFGAFDRFGTPPLSNWSDPDTTLLGTNRRPAPAFPLDRLGPFWSGWATSAAAAASCPIDYPACSLLASIGAAIANVRWPVAGSGWSEPPHLWMGLVGSPSSGKSPGMEAAFGLIRHAEDGMAAGFEDTRRDYETRKVTAKAARDVWEADVKAAMKEGKSPPSIPGAAEEPDAPVRPRIRVGDSTTEKLGALSAGLPRGLLLARDELSGWVANFDRYGGNGSDRSFYLESYGGRSYRVDRMKSPDPIEIRHLSVGVLGTTQPDRLAAITGGADDGLACRFLWCWPDKGPRFSLARDPVDDADARYAFTRLLNVGMGSDLYGNPEPVRLRLAKEAEDAIEGFARDIEDRVENVSGAFSGALGKARGHVLRLATVLEFLWWSGQGSQPEPVEISARAVTTAAGLVGGYFVPMAERVFGDGAIPKAERGAMSLARYLRQHRLAEFNARTVRLRIGGDLRLSEQMDAACRELTEAGLIRKRVSPKATGRPGKTFDVHPVVYGRA